MDNIQHFSAVVEFIHLNITKHLTDLTLFHRTVVYPSTNFRLVKIRKPWYLS